MGGKLCFCKKVGTKFITLADVRRANGDFSSITFKETELQHSENALFIKFGTIFFNKLVEEDDINPAL